MKNLLLLALLFVSACTSVPVAPIAEDTPQDLRQYSAEWSDGQWTAALVRALEEHGQALLSAPIEGACGNRKQFWVTLASALSKYESNFNPAAFYREAFVDARGNHVISRGLFQMSIESSNGNYACGFKEAQEIHDPMKAIPCFVKAANKLAGRDGVIYSEDKPWKGLSAYWSPLRDPKKRDAIMAKARGTCK
jgi:hypothetical protein